MARQILPVFVTPNDVDALKKRLRGVASGTDLGVQACTGLSDTDRAAWGLFYASVVDYVRSDSGWFSAASQMNQGQEYEDNLYTWQQKLQTSGCDVTPVNPQPAEPPGSGIVKWLGVVVVVGVAAYVTHEVASTIHELSPRSK